MPIDQRFPNAGGGSRCFCCFCRKLSADDFAFSPEILARRGLGDRQNSEMARCFPLFRNSDSIIARTALPRGLSDSDPIFVTVWSTSVSHITNAKSCQLNNSIRWPPPGPIAVRARTSRAPRRGRRTTAPPAPPRRRSSTGRRLAGRRGGGSRPRFLGSIPGRYAWNRAPSYSHRSVLAEGIAGVFYMVE
jgi:hypothetical protein